MKEDSVDMADDGDGDGGWDDDGMADDGDWGEYVSYFCLKAGLTAHRIVCCKKIFIISLEIDIRAPSWEFYLQSICGNNKTKVDQIGGKRRELH